MIVKRIIIMLVLFLVLGVGVSMAEERRGCEVVEQYLSLYAESNFSRLFRLLGEEVTLVTQQSTAGELVEETIVGADFVITLVLEHLGTKFEHFFWTYVGSETQSGNYNMVYVRVAYVRSDGFSNIQSWYFIVEGGEKIVAIGISK